MAAADSTKDEAAADRRIARTCAEPPADGVHETARSIIDGFNRDGIKKTAFSRILQAADGNPDVKKYLEKHYD